VSSFSPLFKRKNHSRVDAIKKIETRSRNRLDDCNISIQTITNSGILMLSYQLVNVLSPIRILRTIRQSFFPIEINVLNVVFKFGSEI